MINSDRNIDDNTVHQFNDAVVDAPLVSPARVTASADNASRMIAPLWPLESFVAVNPFLGISHLPFAEAGDTVARIWQSRHVMPRQFYLEQMRQQVFGVGHVVMALDELGGVYRQQFDAEKILALSLIEPVESPAAATIVDIVSDAGKLDWRRVVSDRLSQWAASYFDEGQASWSSPWKMLPAFSAWRSESMLDRSVEMLGLGGFREEVAALPDDADALLQLVAGELGLSEPALDLYFYRLLATVAGWAGHARYRGWLDELAGQQHGMVKQILAVRCAWELILLRKVCASRQQVVDRLASNLTTPLHPDARQSYRVDIVLHTAFEIARRDGLLNKLRPSLTRAQSPSATTRASAQAVFCIDVRSERYRRALEQADNSIETLGFAGFFGFAIEVADIDQQRGAAQCPVLLTPKYLVRETVREGTPEQIDEAVRERSLARRMSAVWHRFSALAISSFAFVETLGLTYAWRLLADGFGWRMKASAASLAPSAKAMPVGPRTAGIALDERIELGAGALAGMSLVDDFARLVLLVGHGSTSTNNPYQTRYNCGACGGHTGEANAQIAAEVLNDSSVRIGLEKRGIRIPWDTFFVAALHDTATDDVTLLNIDQRPPSHVQDVRDLQAALQQATRTTRRERAPLFTNNAAKDVDRAIVRRSTDWSEVRPEWGLAGCMAFVAAPRARTRKISLEGRGFLHSYDWKKDDGFAVLEMIMTAPLVVATWINLQYYASTVDNDTFGSGEKTLHNVVGGIGVLEGIAGDLRVGLPVQSLHDGDKATHEALRLHAVLEAPEAAISAILMKHDHVRELVDNGWLKLFAMDAYSGKIRGYNPAAGWVDAQPASLTADDNSAVSTRLSA